jgi:holliday junction DNA helicase RuvA
MIATLSGVVTEKLDQIVVETGGVGYGVSVPRSDLESVSTGQEVKLFIHEVIRDDTHDLYGFTEELGKELYRQLLSVSGVGPKAALAILSLSNIEHVHKAISAGDVAFIASASCVGKRTAERLVVELQEKIKAPKQKGGVSGALQQEAMEALVSIGYSSAQAREAMQQLPPDQREVIELMYYGGRSQSQIAQELDLPLGTVKSRTLLGMRRLRAALSGMER